MGNENFIFKQLLRLVFHIRIAEAPIEQKLPLRLFYPGTEARNNTSNVNEQGTIDIFSTRTFWDVD